MRVVYAAVSSAVTMPMANTGQYELLSAPARISSFDQNPDMIGMPDNASDAATNVANVTGMYLRRPPILRMSNVWWAAWLTEPAPRNRHALNMAWVNRWKMAPVHAPTP